MLDAGCGGGASLVALRKRYPKSRLIGADVASGMVSRAWRLHRPTGGRILGWLGANWRLAPLMVCADAARLPLASGTVDLVWSNLFLHWASDVPAVLAEWYRVARPGALVSLSLFGVDTLREFRAAGARLMSFPDMHDVGDALVSAGFAEPVLDVDHIQLSYRQVSTMLGEVHAMGGNARRDRSRSLHGRGARARWQQVLEAASAHAAPTLSFEVIQAHAWVPATKRRRDGTEPVVFQRRPPTPRRV